MLSLTMRSLFFLLTLDKKLLDSWRDQFKVLERHNKVDYLIDDPRRPKLYHAKILKRYYGRGQVNLAHVMDQVSVSDDDDTSPRVLFESEDADDPVLWSFSRLIQSPALC